MQNRADAATENKDVKDPVCGMTVGNWPETLSLEHEGQSYYFCSRDCMEKFQEHPEQYIVPSSSAPSEESEKEDAASSGKTVYTCPMHPEVREDEPGDCPKCGMALERNSPVAEQEAVEWTCPMHPEVVRSEPGDCPKCGMALEPRTVAAGGEENREYVFMRNRFWVGAVLSLPLVLIAMRDMLGLGFIEGWAGPKILHGAEFVLATPVVLWCGWVFYVRAWKSVVSWNLNMFTLIGLGTMVAYVYSVVALLFPRIFPASFRSAEGTVGVYFEASAVIVTLVLLGQMLEQRARSRTGAAIKALLGLAPKTARRVPGPGAPGFPAETAPAIRHPGGAAPENGAPAGLPRPAPGASGCAPP